MTYEYECLVCKVVFEIQQSIKDESGSVCPGCSAFCNNRLISNGTSFILKGSGWAAENYSSKTNKS